MNPRKIITLLVVISFLAACTTGRLEYLTPQGEIKFACETEYSWAPSVDKFAVEYVLSHCAKKAAEQGNTVIDKRLLELDLTVVNPPNGKSWSFELAETYYQ